MPARTRRQTPQARRSQVGFGNKPEEDQPALARLEKENRDLREALEEAKKDPKSAGAKLAE